MTIKFKTFNPYKESDYYHGNYIVSATSALNKWLEENPYTEIISWQATPVGTANELYIAIQYRELEVTPCSKEFEEIIHGI
jgi:hypothetical protein